MRATCREHVLSYLLRPHTVEDPKGPSQSSGPIEGACPARTTPACMQWFLHTALFALNTHKLARSQPTPDEKRAPSRHTTSHLTSTAALQSSPARPYAQPGIAALSVTACPSRPGRQCSVVTARSPWLRGRVFLNRVALASSPASANTWRCSSVGGLRSERRLDP